MLKKRTKGYIVDTAKEFNIPAIKVQEVGESMFRFVAETISQGNKKLLRFDEVRVIKWGVFRVKEGRKKFFEKLNNEKSTGIKE